jgi:hypothetical protein
MRELRRRETIDPMRYLAIALLFGCGSPVHQPDGQPRLMAHNEPDPAPSRYVPLPDAAVSVGPDAAPGVMAVSAQTQATLDAIKEKESEPEPAAEVEINDSGVTEEDGVPVIATKQRAWCGQLTCWLSDPACRQRNGGKACRRVAAFACFQFTYRTSGKSVSACVETYGTCEQAVDAGSKDPEIKDITPCAIFRYDPRAK